MFQKARDTAYLESTSLLILVVRWRKPLLVALSISLIASIVFSSPWFITPKYQSSVIFFPSATNSLSKAILDDSPSEKQDILAFGEEEQAEQMLQILNSDEIRSTIIQKYDLMNHYDIDASGSYPQTALYDEFKNNISFSRTEFMSVRIDVLDKEPQTAADIANDIAALVDSMKTKIQRSRATEVLSIVQSEYDSKKNELKQKEDSLQTLRQMGIMDYSVQSEILSNAYTNAQNIFTNETASLKVLEKYKPENDTSIISTKARIQGSAAKMKSLNEQLKNLAQYGGTSISLNSEVILDRQELAKLKTQLDKARVDANENLTHKFIVNRAVKAERKSYPIRWLIILLTLMGTFGTSIIVITAFRKIKEINN